MVWRAAFLANVCLLIGWRGADAQLPEITGYYLNVPSWTDSNLATVGGASDINRFRLMTEPTLGNFRFQVAYEHVLTLSRRPGTTGSGLFVGLGSGGGEWLPLQWTIHDTDHVRWRHRFDRASVQWAPGELLELAAGRLTASWATTLFLTPADPFLPFDPSDPFREYRSGIDAFRLQIFPGPLSDFDLIVRPADFATGTTLSVLGRGRTVWRSWELSGWLGLLYDEPAAAIGAAGGIGSVAVRSEITLQHGDSGVTLRGTAGVDGRFSVWGRDLFYVLEYQRDGFGAGRASELARVLESGTFARGQHQVLGRDEFVAQASYQVHPLWNLAFLLITNVNDPSTLVSPAVSYSISNEVTASGGLYLGFGKGIPSQESPIPSEYGLVPAFLYLSLTAFL
jgi:hypothetical protein